MLLRLYSCIIKINSSKVQHIMNPLGVILPSSASYLQNKRWPLDTPWVLGLNTDAAVVWVLDLNIFHAVAIF